MTRLERRRRRPAPERVTAALPGLLRQAGVDGYPMTGRGKPVTQ